MRLDALDNQISEPDGQNRCPIRLAIQAGLMLHIPAAILYPSGLDFNLAWWAQVSPSLCEHPTAACVDKAGPVTSSGRLPLTNTRLSSRWDVLIQRQQIAGLSARPTLAVGPATTGTSRFARVCKPSPDMHSSSSSERSSTIPLCAIYQPLLGGRLKVCLKLSTGHHPSDLQDGALNTLAYTVANLSKGTVTVVGASVRYGCILISLDARGQQPAGVTAASDALACAKQLLPDLLQQLGLCKEGVRGASAPAGLEPGQYLCLQLSTHLVYATYDRPTKTWQFTSTQVNNEMSYSTPPKLCLATPCQPPANRLMDNTNTSALAFQVHVSCSTCAMLPMVVGSTPGERSYPTRPSVLFTSADADGSGSDSPRKPTLQLWVHCQGQYLQTTIYPSDTSTGPVDSSNQVVLQAVVHLPEAAMARHHMPDGPIARLQLLTAELWDGDNLLSSTSLLLDAKQHLSPAPPSCRFGWWGASAAAVAGMVQELTARAEQLQAAALDGDSTLSTQSHEAFISDLSAWISTIQHAACLTCCDMAHPQLTHRLSLQQCRSLGQHLQQHAASVLPLTFKVLLSQFHQVLGRWQRLACVNAAVHKFGNHTGMHRDAWRLVCVLLLQLWDWRLLLEGYGCSSQVCPVCESTCYSHLLVAVLSVLSVLVVWRSAF